MTDHPVSRVISHAQPAWLNLADTEIDVAIPESPGELERLSVRKEAQGRYTVCCLSFCLYGFSLGDVVSVSQDVSSGVVRVDSVVEKSGHYSFRAVLSDGGDPMRMASLVSTFSSMGCLIEEFSSMMVSIDAENEAKADWVLAVLQDLQDRGSLGVLEYETVYSIPVE